MIRSYSSSDKIAYLNNLIQDTYVMFPLHFIRGWFRSNWTFKVNIIAFFNSRRIQRSSQLSSDYWRICIKIINVYFSKYNINAESYLATFLYWRLFCLLFSCLYYTYAMPYIKSRYVGSFAKYEHLSRLRYIKTFTVYSQMNNLSYADRT